MWRGVKKYDIIQPMSIITASKLSKSYGIEPVLIDASFHINEGDKIGIVGANGAGKSTLMKILAGELEPDSGELHIDKSAAMSYLKQRDHFNTAGTVIDEINASASPEQKERFERKNSYSYESGIPVRNWYKGYRGLSTLREGIVQSMNIVTVKVLSELGPRVGYDFAQQFGISTLVDGVEINGSMFTDVNETLALGGIINDPVNPFTGNPINTEPKNGEQLILISEELNIYTNNGNTFQDPNAYWLSVRDNIYDDDNWSLYEEDPS